MKTEVKANNKTQVKYNKKMNGKKQIKKKKTIKKKTRKIIICTILFVIALAIIVMIMLSGLFPIRKITVINNYKVTKEQIIQNSHLEEGKNIFRTLNKTIKSGIKTNAYIEDVKVTKKINGEIVLDVEERTATYMLPNENGYAYINNQGYVLEITEVAQELPIIKGYGTDKLVLGERLSIQDLKKLELVIQIMEVAKNNGIVEKISAIDIANEANFILEIPSEDIDYTSTT